MKKILVSMMLLVLLIIHSEAQTPKKYGYAIAYLRCGSEDSQRNKIYYSPVIELNLLNFDKYTDGIDPLIPKFSVRYYNYAMSKWFSIYLKEKHRVAINHPERYLRKDSTVVFSKSAACNEDKTSEPCFFTDKAQLDLQRRKEIDEHRLKDYAPNFCEIVEL
jgi:hypothetical protein